MFPMRLGKEALLLRFADIDIRACIKSIGDTLVFGPRLTDTKYMSTCTLSM